jgi:beta-glucanase (GH16 family)
VADGKPAAHNGNLLLTMAEGSVGTVLASTHYVWYGKISATLKTSRGAGVVSAFIMMSDMKDEIDYEWIGVDLETVQTNFYYQGIPDCACLIHPYPQKEAHTCRRYQWRKYLAL